MIAVAVACFGNSASAQTSIEENDIVRSALDEMFEDLDKSRVPTGYLLDYAVDLVELSDYDGTELTDSNYVDRALLADILRSVRSASVTASASAAIPAGATDMSDPLVTLSSTDVSVAAFKYNYIVANALTDGLIEYDEASGKASDSWKGGVWQNPYGESHLLAFAPMSAVMRSQNVKFNFPSNLFYKNETLSGLYFDAGDGGGYREISAGSTISASYPGNGKKELKLKAVTGSGEVLEAHSAIYVAYESMVTGWGTGDGALEPSFVDEYDETWNGITVSAQMTCYMRDGATLRRPFIVAEGFEPLELEMLLDTSVTKLGKITHADIAKSFYNYGISLSDNYDFVYIDWYNSTEDIRANAALFIKLIKEVNRMKAEAGSTEKNVVMGQSMGGLVARYALRTMERNSEEHETTMFVSHDAPHLGANVPLGALYFVHQLMCMSRGYTTAGDLFSGGQMSAVQSVVSDLVNSMAVRQMLVNYVDHSGNIDNSVHRDWQSELNFMGFPQGDDGEDIQNLAIVNGRAYDISKTLAYDEHFFYLDGYAKSSTFTDILAPFAMILANCLTAFSLDFLADFLNLSFATNAFSFWGPSRLNAHAEINPLSSSGVGQKMSELNVSYTKTFFWLLPKTYNLFSATKNVPYSADYYYDDFPGSTYSLTQIIHENVDPTYALDATEPYEFTHYGSNLLGECSYDLGIANKFMFIPVASALAIKADMSASGYMRDYYTNPPEPWKETYFDTYYLYSEGTGHIFYDRDMFGWIADCLEGDISGPEYVGKDEVQYSLTGSDKHVTWSTSNGAVATIDQSGKLTLQGKGTVKVIAEYASPGSLYRKTKEVVVDYKPKMAITYEYIPGTGIRFTANCVNPDEKLRLDKAVAEGYLRYEWSLLHADGDLELFRDTTAIYDYMPGEDEFLTVGLKLVDQDENNCEPLTVTLNFQTPVVFNYSYVIVNSDREVYFIKPDNTYDKGYPSEPFTVSFRGPQFEAGSGAGGSVNPSGDPYDLYMKGDDCYISYPTLEGLEYMEGTKYGAAPDCRWTFPFFDSQIFLKEVENAGKEDVSVVGVGGFSDTGDNAGVRIIGREINIGDYKGGGKVLRMESHVFDELTICNSSKEVIQKMPFTVMYKDEFPESYEWHPITIGGGGGIGGYDDIDDNPGFDMDMP